MTRIQPGEELGGWHFLGQGNKYQAERGKGLGIFKKLKTSLWLEPWESGMCEAGRLGRGHIT